MRTIVCGGRAFDDFIWMHACLSQWPITLVISGHAKGADTLGEIYAASAGIPWVEYPANWARYGDSAGPIRNKQMLDEAAPDIVLAFPGGPGTHDMCRQARGCGVRVVEILKWYLNDSIPF